MSKVEVKPKVSAKAVRETKCCPKCGCTMLPTLSKCPDCSAE